MRAHDPPPQPVLTATIAPGRDLMLGRLPDVPLLVIEDLSSGDRLGAVLSELAAFYLELDGAPQIVLAGVEHAQFGRKPGKTVDLQLPDERVHCRMFTSVAGDRRSLAGWMSFPYPFRPGMGVTAVYRDEDGRKVGRYQTPPLERADLMPPSPDAGWTAFAYTG